MEKQIFVLRFACASPCVLRLRSRSRVKLLFFLQIKRTHPLVERRELAAERFDRFLRDDPSERCAQRGERSMRRV